MLGVITSVGMARKSGANGAQRHPRGDSIFVAEPVLAKILQVVEERGQMGAADYFGVSSNTINKIVRRNQKTLRRELYERFCKKLGMDTSSDPVERILYRLGHMTSEQREKIASMLDSLGF